MKARTEFVPVPPEQYGFGVEVMKRTKVCRQCGAAQHVSRYACGRCGAKLPQQTLFHVYQQRHRLCPVCDTVLAPRMNYCPHCGAELREESVLKGLKGRNNL